MKKHYLLLLIFSFIFSLIQAQTPTKDNFNVKKYDKMIEVDMRGLFSFGPGSGLIYRKKHESGNFVFVDRTRYWRLGFHINGNGERYKTEAPNVFYFNSNTNLGITVTPSVGHETMFHFGRFNLFYAGDIMPSYQYLDLPGGNSPNITHTVSLGLAISGGMRYYFHERFSVSVQTTPLALWGNYKMTTFYGIYDPFTGRYEQTKFKAKGTGFTINQYWLSSLGFTYHF